MNDHGFQRPLRYSINISVDGCCDHRAFQPDAELHDYSAEIIGRADAVIFGRVTYQMMEDAWRAGRDSGMPEWTDPFARRIDAVRKYVVSSTLTEVDWNSELLGGDLREAVAALKREPGEGLYVGGVTLPLALADMGLIDEYEFIVHPGIVGHGPRIFDGLARPLALRLVGRREFASGAVALRYERAVGGGAAD